MFVGYFLFTRYNKETSSTKSDTIVQKFSSLFGISKSKKIDTVVDTGLDKNDPTVPPINIDGSTTPGGTGSDNGSDDGLPKLNPFPYQGGGTPGYNPMYETKSQCSDDKDNDGDGNTDTKDAGCHTDLDDKNTDSYDPWINDESSENGPNVTVTETPSGKCETNHVIIFNSTDKVRIAELLRDFYRLAPGLATREDITIEKGNAKSYKETLDRALEYTNQCYTERNKNWPSASSGPIVMNKQEYANGSNGGVMDSNSGKITIPPGKYMLESKKSPYFTSTRIIPSNSFLPGYLGESFSKKYFRIPDSTRLDIFKENGETVLMGETVVKMDGRGGTPGKVITEHILITMRIMGILKYYIPEGYSEESDNYQKVLEILRREVNTYMNTLKPGRDAWATRKQTANGLSDFKNWADGSGGGCWGQSGCWDTDEAYGGQRQTKEALDSYLRSGPTDELRRVDMGATSYVGGSTTVEETLKNQYQSFEESFNIW